MSSHPLLFDHQPFAAFLDARALNTRATDMANRGDYVSALPLCQQVLVLAQAAHSYAPSSQTTLDMVYAMCEVGMVKRDVGDLPGAQAVLEQAVALAEQPPVGPAHIPVSLRPCGISDWCCCPVVGTTRPMRRCNEP